MARMGDKAPAKRRWRRGRPGRAGHRRSDDARRGARRRRRGRLSGPAEGRRGRRRQGHAARSRSPTSSRTRSQTARRRGAGCVRRPALYVEKVIVPARHVEIQVLADGHGGVLTLGERECSIQRRHQKLIEESPSPALDDRAARRRWRRRPSARARAVGYRERGHVRVPARPGRRVLLHRAERAAPGRASGHASSSPGIDLVREQLRDRRGRAPVDDRPRARARPRDRDPDQRRGSGARLHARARADRALPRRRSAPASASTRTSRTAP